MVLQTARNLLKPIDLNHLKAWWNLGKYVLILSLCDEWEWNEEPYPFCFRFLSISSAAAEKISNYLYLFIRACLHVGGGPQVGEVPRLAVVVYIYAWGDRKHQEAEIPLRYKTSRLMS